MQEFEQKNVKLWTICLRIKRIKRIAMGIFEVLISLRSNDYFTD